MCATDILNSFGTKINSRYQTWTMQSFTFSQTGSLDDNHSREWYVSETDRPGHMVELSDSQVCRILYALSCYADVDVIAESLDLR